VDALEEALDGYGKPEIFNTDQGAQFTSEAFTTVLLDAKITISMDGKDPGLQPQRGEDPAWRVRPSAFQACRRGGRCMDNVFIERLWRSLKYEEVYLHAYDTVANAKAGIGSWISFYNVSRPHQALGYRTPTEIFAGSAGAVDMMDNATRCPHSPQQTTTAGSHLS
jgi:putative transposase